MKKIPLTPDGYQKLQEELEKLLKVDRPQNIKAIAEARAHGDLSENAEYQEARDLQAATEERIRKLDEILKNAKITTDNKKKNEVGFSSKVSIKKEGSEDVHEYTIVGSEEADMRERKLSHVSPLGAALMGRKKGDTFTFETQNGKQTYTIEKVA